MLINKEVWDQVSSPENHQQLQMAVHFLSEKSDEVLMSYYLFIFSSHQHVQYMTSQNLLILIDFDSFFGHFFDLKLLTFKPLKLWN